MLDKIEAWQDEHGVSNAATCDLLELLAGSERGLWVVVDAYKARCPNYDAPARSIAEIKADMDRLKAQLKAEGIDVDALMKVI